MLCSRVIVLLELFSICTAFHVQTTTYDGIPNNDQFELSPFTKIGDKYYFIEATEKLNWFAAAHKCRTKGGNLATIESEDDMQALSAHLVALGKLDLWFWLSGNDLSNENHFQWLGTGNPMVYTSWSGGQPDNAGGDENCVHLLLSGDHFAMNDVGCKSSINYICEAYVPKTISFTIW